MTGGARGEGIFEKKKKEKGRGGARLGRQAAHVGMGRGGRLGRKWGRRGEGERKCFLFLKSIFL
jgi:hypothetical protein